MTLSKEKVDIIFAKRKQSVTEFCEKAGFSRNRFYTILNSKNISPKTAGRVAEALGVDVTEILAD